MSYKMEQDNSWLVQQNKLLELGSRLTKVGSWRIDITTMTSQWSQGMFHIFDLEPGGNSVSSGAKSFFSES
ncbi:hypothetical protein GH811_03225 [Acetobacterium malicum]|uniref:Uncharacterized protein n=1 Tax=Acetobacterium malicum TaxID=52692 RepID=A0ABR6YTW3_9FIRM|nr:hypothetical protein [Acetobacterium malicum]MBC3898623.1 hypothetical protein [Acetobacterium malicum]